MLGLEAPMETVEASALAAPSFHAALQQARRRIKGGGGSTKVVTQRAMTQSLLKQYYAVLRRKLLALDPDSASLLLSQAVEGAAWLRRGQVAELGKADAKCEDVLRAEGEGWQ